MKTKLIRFVLAIAVFLVATGCSKDEDHTPNGNVIESFNRKYPMAQQISWEIKAGYHVVDFIYEGNKSEAWFDDSGNWIQTETDLKFNQLPLPVQHSFQYSSYAAWEIEDIVRLERDQAPAPVYILEVEKGDREVNLHYDKEGSLMKVVPNTDHAENEYLPVTIPLAAREYINQYYPDAIVVDFDKEKTGFEITILHNYMYILLSFDTSNNWVSTSWIVTFAELPEKVAEAFRGSVYQLYAIAEIHRIKTKDGIFFKFKLERNNQDTTIYFDREGNIVKS